MEEENELYDRIGEADLNPIYKDGQVYQHTDVNNMLSILKTAVNENYYDIQKLENGEKTVGNADKLKDAELSRYLDEQLQPDDNKVPSSQQVKAYIDDLFDEYSPPIRGVDYWTDDDKEYIIDEAVERTIDTDLRWNPRGEYDDEVTYVKYDVVRYNGSAYIAKVETTGNTPLNTNYWELVVEKGDKGDSTIMSVDVINADLIIRQTDNAQYSFNLNENGNLEVVD